MMSEPNLASDIYHLSPDEIERWDFVYATRLEAMLEADVAIWRENLKKPHATTEACRWEYLTSCCPEYETSTVGKDMEWFPSVIRYLCMRTEQAVNASEPPLGAEV